MARIAAFAGILLAFLACGSETTAPLNRVVALDIVADPPADTVRLADTVILTIHADSLSPTSVAWKVEPDTVAIAGDTLRYAPTQVGTTCVRAVAEFEADRVGSDARCFFTPTNSAPSVTIALPPGEEFSLVANFNLVALGDTIVLIAVIDDPDDDVIDAAHIRWLLNEAGDAVLAGTGDTLRLPVTEVREYDIEVAVMDRAGNRSTARYFARSYVPGPPVVWRKDLGGFYGLSEIGDGILVASTAGSGGTPCCPLVGLALDGTTLWSVDFARQSSPQIPTDNSAAYVHSGSTVSRVRDDGSVDWVVDGVVLAPAMMADGSLIVPSRDTGGTQPVALHRITVPGGLLWDTPLDSIRYCSGLAIGADSLIYVLGDGQLRAVTPSGTLGWLTEVPGGTGVIVASDSTLIVEGSVLYAVATTGAIRWSRSILAASDVVVGAGGQAFEVVGTRLRAFRVADGEIDWEVPWEYNGSLAPVLTSDGGIVLSAAASVILVDAATGTERWRIVLDGWGVGQYPLLTPSGLLLVWDSLGYLHAIDLGVGPLDAPWPQPWADWQRHGRLRQ